MQGQNRIRYLNSMTRALQSAAQTSLAVNAWQTITWDATDDFDTDTLHNPASNNSRITVAIAGKYRARCAVALNNTGVTGPVQMAVRIILNGGTAVVFAVQASAPTTIAATTTGTIEGSDLINLAASDYIEAQAIYVATSGTWDTVPANMSFSIAYEGE
jgi:hypothetical protein